MDYNTGRNKLVIAEYGRNVQKMVEHALTVEDKDKRSRLAALIVNVMTQLNPSIKEMSDYKQKLWDHLHIISDFKLNVDSPYPVPDKETLLDKPDKISYQANGIKYRHYGQNIETIIKRVCEIDDEEKRTALTHAVANHMKKAYIMWNKESVSDEVIASHLAELSKGALVLGEDVVLARSHELLQKQGGASNSSRQKKRQGQSSYKGHGYNQQSPYHRQKRSKRN